MTRIERIMEFHPSKKYPAMTVADFLENFIDYITLDDVRFELRMWRCKKFGEKTPARLWHNGEYKKGVLLENGWFIPNDKSFNYCYGAGAEIIK